MSRIHKARPRDYKAVVASLCPDCGKVRYLTKADAKKSTRRQGKQRSRYYKCGEYWHATHWAPAKSVIWYRGRR